MYLIVIVIEQLYFNSKFSSEIHFTKDIFIVCMNSMISFYTDIFYIFHKNFCKIPGKVSF